MKIGIDGSRAFVEQKTGTEFYSYEMLMALASLQTKNVEFVVYIKPQQQVLIPDLLKEDSRFRFVEIPWSRLWTQGGLAMRTWIDGLDVLWVPAHTLPVLGNPFISMLVTIHGIEYQYLPTAYNFFDNYHLTWSTRWAVFRSTKIIAVSQQTKKDLIDWIHVKDEKISVIPEGVDLQKFSVINETTSQQALKKFSLKSKNYILFVGTVQPRKNLVRLIQAFALSKEVKMIPEQLELVIVGKKGWNYEEILEAPVHYGVEKYVSFLGYVDDVDLPSLYKFATVYVEPSLQEGFGLPILEAVASEVPVLASKSGALPEVGGQAAIYVDPTSVSSIVSGLTSLFSDLPLKKVVPGSDIGDGFYEVQMQGVDGSFYVKDTSLIEMNLHERRKRLVKLGQEQLTLFSWSSAAKQLLGLCEKVVS